VNIDLSDNSWRVRLICGISGEDVPIAIVRNANKEFSFAIIGARDGVND